MYYILSCVAFILLANSLPAAVKLTLDQALDLADRSHPQLQASGAQVDVARAGIMTARAYPNPETAFLGGHQMARVPNAVAGSDFLYTFSQPLELGQLRPSRVKLAELGVESSQFFLAETRLAVLGAVRRAFYEVLRRRSEIALARENLRRVEDLRKRVEVRVQLGEAGTIELNRAEAEAATAMTLANSAQLQLVTAMSQFQAAVGAPLAPDVELEDVPPPPAQLPPLDQLRQEVLERHPTLALMRSEVRRAEARVNYETALRRPQPSLRTEVERLPDSPAFRIGVALPVPFWNRREGPIAESIAAVRQANQLAQARQIQILALLEGAYGRYQVAGQQIASFEQGVLRNAELALQGAEMAYQLGERGIIEVLDAQRILHTVRQGYLNAQYEQRSALLEINQSRAEDLRRPIP
ncbi:MAG: TolC family protein [Acidobacteriia bacterium]|nr:TolC family protein [Terriglobia bacterium]